MAARISRDDFVAFVNTLAGQELTTRAQHRPFTVSVNPNGLEFMPSSQKPRQQSFADIDDVLEEFAASGSLQPGDYQPETMNRSYLLTLIAMYLERPTGVHSP